MSAAAQEEEEGEQWPPSSRRLKADGVVPVLGWDAEVWGFEIVFVRHRVLEGP